MSTESPKTVEKIFSIEEFTDLLTRAANHLVERCRTEYCEPPPPASFRFILRPGGAESEDRPPPIVSTEDVVRELLRPDGAFRDWINLSPVGIAGDSTILAVEYPDRFTKRLIVGTLAFLFEPFELRGPTLPNDWVEGTPLPKVALPFLERPAV
jgi:hypothetical protein